MVKNKITIEVAYAKAQEQSILKVVLDEGSTIEQAILYSGICAKFPEIDLNKVKVGIFSKQQPLTNRVKEGDRIEIYRPLLVDPKEARRAKAKKTKRK